MSEWWRKVMTERETEQKLFYFGIRICYFPARAPVKSLRGWVSSHLYPRFTFKKPKALMNCTFQENQKTNILWKLSQKRWCHIWCMKMDSQIHSKSWITEDHIRRWPWKASFARLCWIYNHLSSFLQTLHRHCQHLSFHHMALKQTHIPTHQQTHPTQHKLFKTLTHVLFYNIKYWQIVPQSGIFLWA